MRLTAKSEYACLAMLQLVADHERPGPTTLKRLAREQHIPETFLVQILQELRKMGLVRSLRGAAGGYRLAKPPESISLADVIDATDGVDPPTSYLDSPSPMGELLLNTCQTVHQQQRRTLQSVSLADLVNRVPVTSEPMWYI